MLAAGAGEEAGCTDALEAEADLADEEAMPSAVTAGIGGVGKSWPD